MQIVYSHGETPFMIYIVKEGEFEVFRERFKQDDKSNNYSHTPHHILGTHNHSNLLKHTLKGQKEFIILTQLCSGQLFGEDDALNKRPYTTSVRCISSKGVIKSIKIDEFV